MLCSIVIVITLKVNFTVIHCKKRKKTAGTVKLCKKLAIYRNETVKHEIFFMHSKFFGKFLSFMAAFKISPFSRSNI